jgi:2,3-dihydroxy-p-cumate/2,3-dihydroxybenzoate 3,4-dioxygenase
MIRYQKLGYVGLNVTDIERARRFYEEIVGLQFVETCPDGTVLLRCSDDYHSVSLYAAPTPGFRHVGIMLESDQQYEVLRQRLDQHHIPHEQLSGADCESRRVQSAWRIAEPHMHAAFEFYRPRPQDAKVLYRPSVAKIQRIGHVVFGTPHYEETLTLLREVLNFAQSDDIDSTITFFRAFPNPYHHGIGVGRAPRNLLHHVNFMVSEIDDIGSALNRFKRHQVPVVFGPGRHIASNSVFLYYLEPDQMTLEYSFGMEEFPEVAPRAARTLPQAPESLDSWGGIRDKRMSAVGDVQPFSVGAGFELIAGTAP